MKIKIEIEKYARESMNFSEWLSMVTENLCEWTEKHKYDKATETWVIEIEGK